MTGQPPAAGAPDESVPVALRDAVAAVKAILAGDGPGCAGILNATPSARMAFGMTALLAVWLVTQPRLTPAQQVELLDTAHAALVEQFLVSTPARPDGDLDTALAAIFTDGAL